MGRRLVALLALALIVSPNLAGATMTSSLSGIDSRLRLEWEASQSGSGQPVVGGYLYNDYMLAASNVILLVEALDASGQVVERKIRFLPGIVPVFGRTYFQVPLKAAGASYRITVTSFQWFRADK